MDTSDEFWMRMAIDIAKQSKTPYGAVLIDQDFNYVTAFNTTKIDGPAAHAEINIIGKLDQLDHNTAEDLTLFSTVEPCPMCMSGIIWANIGRLVFGASIATASKYGYQIPLTSEEITAIAKKPVEIRKELLSENCEALLKSF